jgi:polysaccharide pyruvyl transferase WcaK-like protein
MEPLRASVTRLVALPAPVDLTGLMGAIGSLRGFIGLRVSSLVMSLAGLLPALVRPPEGIAGAFLPRLKLVPFID